MIKFFLLLRTVYSLVCSNHLESMSVVNALFSKEPYHQLCLLLLNRSLELPLNLELVEGILKCVDVNYLNSNGWSLLHLAAYQKNCLLMQTCIKNHANLMITDRNGNSSLHIIIQVAQKRKNNLMQCLENEMINNSNLRLIDEKDDDEKVDYLKIVELILNSACSTKNGSNRINRNSSNSLSSLNSSNSSISSTNSDSSNNSSKEYQMLNHLNDLNGLNDENNFNKSRLNSLFKESNEIDDEDPNLELVNKQNVFGKSPLHYAVFLKPDKHSKELISKLIQKKANPNISDYRNCTPLFYLLSEHQNQHQIVENQTINRKENWSEENGTNATSITRTQANAKFRIKNCSKNCKLRSPFIDLLVETKYYKCDRLNLDELDYGITSLKQLCRKTIQKCLDYNSTSTGSKDNRDNSSENTSRTKFQTFLQSNINSLPVSLCNYLSRRTL